MKSIILSENTWQFQELLLDDSKFQMILLNTIYIELLKQTDKIRYITTLHY